MRSLARSLHRSVRLAIRIALPGTRRDRHGDMTRWRRSWAGALVGLSVGCNGLLRNDDAYLDLDATSDAVSMGGGGGEASSTTAGGRGGASGSLDDGGGGGGAPIDVDRDAAFVDRVADTAVDTSDDSSIRDGRVNDARTADEGARPDAGGARDAAPEASPADA